MTKRERIYFARKRFEKYLETPLAKLKQKVWGNMMEWHMAGTECFINEQGNVEVRCLSIDECMDILEKKNNGEIIPNNISFAVNEDR